MWADNNKNYLVLMFFNQVSSIFSSLVFMVSRLEMNTSSFIQFHYAAILLKVSSSFFFLSVCSATNFSIFAHLNVFFLHLLSFPFLSFKWCAEKKKKVNETTTFLSMMWNLYMWKSFMWHCLWRKTLALFHTSFYNTRLVKWLS